MNAMPPNVTTDSVTVTFFPTYAASTKREEACTLPALAERIRTTTASEKERLPWLKLARFGEAPSAANCLRHDENVVAITGVEADYDGGMATFDYAQEVLTMAGLRSLLYTSPSSTIAAPRWRVLCPTSRDYPPAERSRLLDRLNGLFRGAFSIESWTVSQSYYFGSVRSNPFHQVAVIDGTPIDLLDELDAGAIGRPQPAGSSDSSGGDSILLHAPSALGPTADVLDVVSALAAIPNDGSACWVHWNNVGLATWAATSGSTAGYAAWCAWSEHHPTHDPAACAERWTHYRTSPPTRSGAGTLFHLARQARPDWRRPSDQVPTGSPTHGEATKPALWEDGAPWVEAEIPPRPWVARGYLLRGAVTVLSGASSVSKSTLAVGYTVSLALGQPFNRFTPAQPCRVLVYNVEDDADEQRRRFSAVLRQFDAVPDDLTGKVRRIGPSSVGTLLERDPGSGKLVLTAAMLRLQQVVEAFEPDVLILDPLVELHGAEENDNTALRAVMARFRALAGDHRMAVAIVHHARKGASMAAPGDPDTLRGASSIVGAARIVLTVSAMTEDEAKTFGLPPEQRRHFFRVDAGKSNYAPLHEAEWFERAQYVLDNGDAVAAPVAWAPPQDAMTPEAQVKVEAAIRRGSPQGPLSPLLGNSPRSVKHAMVAAGIVTAPGQKDMLAGLYRDGFQQVRFRDQFRKLVNGLRSPDGLPGDAEWEEAEGDVAA